MTKAELWLNNSFDSGGRLGIKSLEFASTVPPSGRKDGVFKISVHFAIKLLLRIDNIKNTRHELGKRVSAWVSEHVNSIKRDLLQMISRCRERMEWVWLNQNHLWLENKT